ncbi:A/G-specific adenine glycosylase [Lentilactobacillus buchneri]|uniref:Adenine DNA glycosylase n=1 Tax=Lentilactobacillus buchneri subsp. silagei CD034 TaxID=1071400 RepID=J9W5K1_LENBU|nr:A/G-specific adenine glycosylase [Lentilactobacillus buchneri]MCC6100263.1 A/G-specific adenine glycosylase [Lactobacillus sp.]AFS00275.1 A/G-specific adenine glycosylase [Lentilactobacillus buchneri subsp. silagei CD034]MCT2900345.1 A/G-specific adenine glycosylase [Lentilactobacillus buchneri]MCT3541901.1 A/G-specific adenine glycosylase [Lentilactobacillus buchneri]MCT3545018.1 A/G-specific adenine glycosylase [Lentilactobacillus buchneri]
MIKWSNKTIKAFQETLLAWYDQNKRDLPWRQDQDPYHVWVSEIMLQQTQVETVIPYYLRFMNEFPTIEDLAAAPEDKLMKAWEGLGYYSRARNLQKAAQQIVFDYQGQWPTTAKELQELSGIGPYTAGAIASIAFGQPVAAVDGNAFRVFARLLEIDDDVAKPHTRQVFEKIINPIVPKNRPGDFNQAIMDLGASYMTATNYDTSQSPVKDFNQSYLDGIEDHYPVKTKKKRPVRHDYFGVVIHSKAGYLFEKRPSHGILANFWMFPLFDRKNLTDDQPVTESTLIDIIETRLQTDYQLSVALHPVSTPTVVHTFTHQQWKIKLLEGQIAENIDLSYFPGKWIHSSEFDQMTFSKVQSKMWSAYQKTLKSTQSIDESAVDQKTNR